MIDVAYAMAQPAGQSGGGSDTIMALLPMILIFAVFYIFLIRPQQKKAREQQDMISNLKKGDGIITQGGIYGKIAAVTDDVLTVEVADKVRIRVAKSYVAGLEGGKPSDSPITPSST